jgi:hypothetical protein
MAPRDLFSLETIFYPCIITAMPDEIIKPPRVSDLIRIGISSGHASEILRGVKMPSIQMARRIEAATGYPITGWPPVREGSKW